MKAPRSGRARLLTAVVSVAVVGAAVAGYLALTAGPATARQFATLTVLEGTVEVQETGTPGFRPGATGDTLRQGDVVRTGDDGKADIEFFDGSVTRLDVGTELRLKELASVPDVPDSKTIVSDQSSGKTLNRVVELTDSESRFETETPNAVASVRGTVYVTIVYPNGSSEYWVLSGTLIILLADGTTVELNAGQGVFVDAEGNAGEIFEVTDADVEALCELDPEFCSDEVEGTEIEEEDGEEEGDDVQGTTVTREETDDDVTLIPPLVIIRDDPPPSDNDPPETTIESGPQGVSEERDAEFVVQSDEPNSTFECSLEGGGADPAFGPCPTPPDEVSARQTQATGATSLTVLYTDLIDAAYSLQVRATDAAGNTDNSPAETAWEVSAPPAFEIIGPVTVDGDTASASLWSDENVTFLCKLEPRDEVFSECPGGLVAFDEEAPEIGTTLITVFDALNDGLYTLVAKALDGTSKESPTDSETFTIDTPPELTIDGPDDPSDSRTALFTIASDQPATFECQMDDAGFEDCPSPPIEEVTLLTAATSTQMQAFYGSLADGEHTFEVRASDATDNASSESYTWTISAPPETTISNPVVEGDSFAALLTSDEPGIFECMLEPEEDEFGDCQEADQEAVELTNTLDASASLSVEYPDLEPGAYTLHARAIDLEGNEDPDPDTEPFEITPSEPPDTQITGGPSGVVAESQTSATFLFGSIPGGATFECRLEGESFSACESPMVYNGLSTGPHQFTVRAVNAAGPDPTPATRAWRIGTPDAITVTLAWTTAVSDLDLHVLTPAGEVAWESQNQCLEADSGEEESCWANLDFDERFGPPGDEIITIRPSVEPFTAGHFTVFVHNWSCQTSLDATGASVTIFGGGIDETFSLADEGRHRSLNHWEVAVLNISELGLASFDPDPPVQTLTHDPTEGGSCPEPPTTDRSITVSGSQQPAQTADDDSTTTEIRPILKHDQLKVEWEPAELEGEVRVSTEEFPDEITDGELGCRGIGHCVIEDVEPGTTLYLTVFPTGVTALDPVEDMTSVRVEIPPLPEPSPSPDPEPADENDPPPDGTPPEDPEPTPSPSPPPAE